MAKKIESKFLIIEATASEFMNAGFGAGPVTDCGMISGGIFDGFSMIDVGTGERIICDFCNGEVKPEDTCYYVAVLNQILCKDCFERWHAGAKFYSEDVPIERKNYDYTASRLQMAETGVTVEA